MRQSGKIGLDSLACGKRRTISKPSYDLDLDWTMPSVELVGGISIYDKFQVSSGLNHLCFSIIVYTDRKTDREANIYTHRRT